MSILDHPFVLRIRRNHALEHATIHVLQQKHKGLQLVGRSSPSGFYIYGEVDTNDLSEAVSEALARLQSGETDLAVHPRCGTNVATAGVMAGLTAFTVMSGRSRSRFEKLPQVLLASTAAILLAQPLGVLLQSKVTTSPDVQDLRIIGISRQERGRMTIHHVRTEQD